MTKITTRNCLSAPGILYPLDGGVGVSIVIAREMMCLKLLRNQFRGRVLTIHEPCFLSQDIVAALSLKITVLKPGNYPVEEADGFFKLNFNE